MHTGFIVFSWRVGLYENNEKDFWASLRAWPKKWPLICVNFDFSQCFGDFLSHSQHRHMNIHISMCSPNGIKTNKTHVHMLASQDISSQSCYRFLFSRTFEP